MPGWLKAGLIGSAIVVVSTLLSLVPVIGICSFLVTLGGYVASGVLAAHYLPPRREGGRAAGQGALAGLIAGLAGGLLTAVLTPLSLNMSGGTQAIISQLPPQMLEQYQQMGIDPSSVLNTGLIGGLTLLCCLPGGLILGALLGALGGLVYAAARPE